MKIVICSTILNSIAAVQQLPYYARETSLKIDVLSGNVPASHGLEYDPGVPPKTAHGDSPLVNVGINLFKLKEIDIATSVMSLNAWVRISWNDPRLAWNTTDPKYLDVKETTYKASTNPEVTQVWVPDLELYNQAESLSQFSDKDAIVYPDGSVFWSRIGNLEALCAFSGLKKHPYDHTECTIDLAGWIRSGLFANYTLMDPPISYGGTGTSQTTYQEYGVLKEGRAYHKDFYYPCCPDEPWPTLSFTFVFDRKTAGYYNRSLVSVMIIFAFLASSVFFFDVRCGERLGFGITVLLAMVATEIIASDILPTCPELLWIEAINYGSTLTAILCLVESCVVTYIYFKQRKEDISEYLSESNDRTENNSDTELRKVHDCKSIDGSSDKNRDAQMISNNESDASKFKITLNDYDDDSREESDQINNNKKDEVGQRLQKSISKKCTTERSLDANAFKLVKNIDNISFKAFIVIYPLFLIFMYSSLPFQIWNDDYALKT